MAVCICFRVYGTAYLTVSDEVKAPAIVADRTCYAGFRAILLPEPLHRPGAPVGDFPIGHSLASRSVAFAEELPFPRPIGLCAKVSVFRELRSVKPTRFLSTRFQGNFRSNSGLSAWIIMMSPSERSDRVYSSQRSSADTAIPKPPRSAGGLSSSLTTWVPWVLKS
jgi:hypothetical protein